MKLVKLFSPFSFVILLMALFAIFGAGCDLEDNDPVPEHAGLKTNGIPRLDIFSPGLSVQTKEEIVHIIGETDQPEVYVVGGKFEVIDGRFEVDVPLAADEITIPVVAGNGQTTTTINIKVKKQID